MSQIYETVLSDYPPVSISFLDMPDKAKSMCGIFKINWLLMKILSISYNKQGRDVDLLPKNINSSTEKAFLRGWIILYVSAYST